MKNATQMAWAYCIGVSAHLEEQPLRNKVRDTFLILFRISLMRYRSFLLPSFPRARMQGFTLIEIMVVLLILAISLSVITLALPNSETQNVEREADRFRWVLEEAHAEALRHRQPMQLRMTSEGYALHNVPPSLQKEDWAQPHKMNSVVIMRTDTDAPYTITTQPIPETATWRLRDGTTERNIQS